MRPLGAAGARRMGISLINAYIFPPSCKEIIPVLPLCHSNARNDRGRQ